METGLETESRVVESREALSSQYIYNYKARAEAVGPSVAATKE